MEQCELLRGAVSAILLWFSPIKRPQPIAADSPFTNSFSRFWPETIQNRPYPVFHAYTPRALGPHDRLQRLRREIQIIVHQHVIVQTVIPNLPGCVGEPPP